MRLRRHDAQVVSALQASSTVMSFSHAVAGSLWSIQGGNERQNGNSTKQRSVAAAVVVVEPSRSITAPLTQVVVDVNFSHFAFSVISQGGALLHDAENMTFLKRIGALSKDILVWSRGSGTSLQWSMHNGNASESPPATASSSPGVSIRVQGLFHVLLVRQKAMRPAVEFDFIRASIAAYALAFPWVSVSLRDMEKDGNAVMTLGAVRSAAERLVQLYGGESADVAFHSSSTVEVCINVVRGVTHASQNVQFAHVNGTPVHNLDWLLKPLVKGLASLAHGPQQAGVPRAYPVLLVEITVARHEVEWETLASQDELPNALNGAVAGAKFANAEAVLRATEQAATHLGVASLSSKKVDSARSAPRGVPTWKTTPPPRMTSHSVPRGASRSIKSATVGTETRQRRQGDDGVLGTREASDVVRDLISDWEGTNTDKSIAAVVMKLPPSPLAIGGAGGEVSLQRSQLSHTRVVGQLNNKVIVAVLEEKYLVAFDQHAVSERIILERLLDQLQAQSSAGFFMELCSEFVPAEASLRDAASRWIAPLSRWWRLQVTSTGMQIQARALCCEDGHLSAGDMLEYLHDLISSRGLQTKPRAVERLLAFRACRGAIKFGDPLDGHCMKLLLADLSKCSYPFQCAHGRQSVMLLSVM